jgi:hypothetical protein
MGGAERTGAALAVTRLLRIGAFKSAEAEFCFGSDPP